VAVKREHERLEPWIMRILAVLVSVSAACAWAR
jgi:hypothetical protein